MDQTAFEEKLRETQELMAENAVLQPTIKRDNLIEDLLRINSHGATSPFDYNLQKRYEILCVGNVDRLIRKQKDPANGVFKFLASLEVFDIVKAAHEGIGHDGGKKTIAEVKKKWSNITQEVCYLYILFCEHCHQKKARKVLKGLVVKPVRSHHIFSRCQIDLINFQTLPDGDYKYIMTCVYHFIKFCVLCPLTTKRAEEVAAYLLDIFLTFGAPDILQSDNGREFVNAVIAELSTIWPELKLVTGRPRHPQSQGAVERLNGVIQDKLAIWIQENNSKKWSVGLKFVQWQNNISRHETTGHSPFKVTFGQEHQVGLGSSVLPRSALNEIATEEDLQTFVENEEGDEDAGDEDAVTGATAEVQRDEDAVTGATAETQSGCFQEIRDAADAGQSKAAVRMTHRGNQLVRRLEVWQCATLRVPDVDRGPTDPMNLLVVAMKEDGLCTVGCREGVLGSKYTAADLSPIDQVLIKADHVPDIRLTLTTATAKATGGQGFIKCQCRTQCSSGRCSCRKKEMKCNSRCHPGRAEGGQRDADTN
ncbi:KRAB-A domain-containing protein 2-like [Palaemon carinicauda]|uniref:KRAB-A domain-containing protein 2-like n=1 Tax=Palaemon carinicauda TaxID=392227 RepID=UPI0035B576EC